MASESDERRVTAWIGQGVTVEGRIKSAQDLRIDGNVDGTIEVGDHSLTIGKGATIKAGLVARSILISGAVVGDVVASERVELKSGGSVDGDLTSPRLTLEDGATVNGAIDVAGNRAARATPA
jgi:cytoskeletal protein CcmA (bactofilin family)